MLGSFLISCRVPTTSGVTLVCKHSHVFKNVCQGRLLLQRGNNGSLIQKQYIRGLPRHKADTEQHEILKGWPFLAKHFLMTVTICGCSFAGAIVWDHVQVARGVRRIPTLYVVRYKGVQISFAKMFGYIFVANSIVFAMWRIPRLLPFMQRYFLSSPCKEQSMLGGFLHSFSHENFLHFFVNMYVLWSFSNALAPTFGNSHFLALYCSGAAVSNYLSLATKVLRRIPNPSLGASGALCAVIGVVGCAFPDSQFSIAFVDQIYPHSFSAKTGILALISFDTLGVLLRWKTFDHAAHLGGTLFGIFYVTYGADLVRKSSKTIIKYWHKLSSVFS